MTKEDQREQEILKLQKIDCLVKCLGTMVMKPEYDTDPTTFQKVFKGTIQQPILVEKYREDALNKINSLINEL